VGGPIFSRRRKKGSDVSRAFKTWLRETFLATEAEVEATRAASRIERWFVVKSKRDPQEHILEDGATVTLCGINTANWSEMVVVEDATTTNCPVCTQVLKDRAKAANADEAAAKAGAEEQS
jgi:hypothetical protein